MSLLDIWNGLTLGLFRLLVCLSVRESVHQQESQLLSCGSLLLLFLVLDICNTLGKGGVATNTDSRNIREGVPTIYVRLEFRKEDSTELKSTRCILSKSDLCVEFPGSCVRSIFNISTMNIGNV